MRRFSGSRRALLRLGGMAGVGLLVPRPPGSGPASARAAATPFVEVPPAVSGISWAHENAMSPERFLPETLGPGCAFFDYDNDGWQDVLLVNSGPCDFYRPEKPLSNALYRNNGDGTFTDVTRKAGLAGDTFAMGVAVADYDNDGWQDVLVTAYGRCTLYHNRGDGTFEDVTEEAGVAAPGWTTSAVWFDYDNDGRLDLFLCSFVEFGVDINVACGNNKLGQRFYCIPRVFRPTACRLFHNEGDGSFREVGQGTDIEYSLGKALGVVATDVDGDRRMDLFVANDTEPNFLFMNRGDGRWEEIGLPAEVGFSANGQARSGMGVDSADFDSDGLQDLFVANVDQEMFSLYRNEGDESFRDVAQENGVSQATRFLSGWGLKFFDYDLDGHLDLLLANGHPDDMIDSYGGQVTYAMPLVLFHNDGGRLRDVSAESGPVFEASHTARGLAIGDYDNDGRIDVLVANNGRAPVLLRNRAGADHHWVGLHLEGRACNRDAVGARLRWSVGGSVRQRLKVAGGSYLSAHDPREVLGLGTATKLDWLEIAWPAPSQRVDRFEDVPVDRYLRVVESEGIVPL